MQKKLTITVDADVYEGLHSVIGRRKISRFLTDLARPHVAARDTPRWQPTKPASARPTPGRKGCSRM